jgi:hypothetical protein
VHGQAHRLPHAAVDEFYISGDVAVVLSNYRVDHEHTRARDVDTGRAIEVFERRDGRWINPYWHLDPGKR